MEDDREKLLARQAKAIARLKNLLDQIRSLLGLFQGLKQEHELHHLFCGCCDDPQV